MEPSKVSGEVPEGPSLEDSGAEPQTLESPMPEETLAGNPAVKELVGGAGLGFRAGDFVWGKEGEGCGHLWPGRIRDTSAPPEHVKPAAEEGDSVLVAFFGGNSVAWCHPSQLVPYEEGFARSAKRSSSRSFVAALESSLEEMERCFILEMGCGCTDPMGGKEESSGDRCSGTNCSPAELLELVSAVAGDVLAADMLEVTKLRSWVIAFACGGGQRCRGIEELVDNIDLDAPPVEEEEDDYAGAEGRAAGVAVKKEELHGKRPYPRAKRKSVAKIIAQMDLNATDDGDGAEEAKDSCADDAKEAAGDDKSPGFDEGNDASLEEALSGKRERKKSKYLSFPYTNSSGHGRQAASSGGDLEVKVPGQASSPPQEPLVQSPAMVRCNSSVNKEEKDLKSPELKLDRISMYEIQSELLAVSLDVANLKWNRLAMLIKWFFAMYRCSSYSDGVNFEAHQKHLAESGCPGMNSAYGFGDARLKEKETSSRRKRRKIGPSGEIQSDSGRKKRMRKEKPAEENQDATSLGQDKVDGSETSKVSSPKGKSKKPAASGQSSGSTAMHTSEAVVISPGMETKDDAAITSMPSLCNDAIESPENIKTAATKKGKKAKAPSPSDPGSSAKDTTNGPKKRTRKGESNAWTAKKGVEHGDTNGCTTGKAKRRRKNTGEAAQTADAVGFELNGFPGSPEQMLKGSDLSIWEKAIVAANQFPNGAVGGKPATVLLISFAPGVALPSKDDLCSEFARYGDLILDETEVQEDARRAVVVFASSVHAERAMACVEKSGVFAPPNATYSVDHTQGGNTPRAGSPVPKPPLSYIRKNLERMISTLAGSSPVENNAGGGDGKENLVGEMQGLLEKVNKMLSCTPS